MPRSSPDSTSGRSPDSPNREVHLTPRTGSRDPRRHPFDATVAAFVAACRAEALSERTIEFYLEGLNSYRAFARFGAPRAEQEVLFQALASGSQSDIDGFLCVITGATPIREFLTPRNLLRIIGWRGFDRIFGRRIRRPSRQASGASGA